MRHIVSILLTVHMILGTDDFDLNFSRTYIGVTFTPYIEKPESINDLSLFYLNNKTGGVDKMLELISTKFSRILVDPDVLESVIQENRTTSDSLLLRTALGATKLNAAQNKTILSIFLGLQADVETTIDEVYAAMKISQVANIWHNDTVKGLVFTAGDSESIEWLGSAITYSTVIRNLTENQGLKIGSLLNCENVFPEKFRKLEIYQKQVALLLTQLFMVSDFVICKFYPHAHHGKHGARYTFSKFRHILLRTRYVVQRYNPNMDIHGITAWRSNGSFSWDTVKEFVTYWSEVNKFAVANNFSMWLREAFDNPLWEVINYTDMVNTGWWKFQKGVDHKGISGSLVEKYSELYSNISKVSASRSAEFPTKLSSTNMLAYVGVGFGFVALVVVGTIIVLLNRRYAHLRNSLPKQEISNFIHGVSENPIRREYDHNSPCLNHKVFQMPYQESIEISKDMLEISNEVLGEGEFGCVYKARLNLQGESIGVALKVAKGMHGIRGIMSEIKVLTFIGRHQNVVSICGAYTKEIETGNVYLALEFCEGGCLRDHLKGLRKSMTGNTDSIIPTLHRDMLRWSLDICRGLIHLKNHNVVHGDLASRNILLCGDGVAKITDFGLSRKLYDNLLYKKKQLGPLPWRWMAIESLKKSEFSTQSDIWGYGVVLWEIYSLGDVPFPSYEWSQDFISNLENGMRLKKPRFATEEIYDIMMDCWQRRPDDRLTCDTLEVLIHNKFSSDLCL